MVGSAVSLVTVSKKNGRTYQRKFDHEEAERRYDAGESVAALAQEYGVVVNAVRRIVVPASRAAYDRYQVSLKGRGHCDRCGGPMHQGSRYRGSRLCRKCFGDDQATSVRPDALLCFGCREWKPDHEFPHNRSKVRRRGRHSFCRACNTIQRRAHRQRNLEASRAYDRAYGARRRGAQKVAST